MPSLSRFRVRPMTEGDLDRVAALEFETFGREAWPFPVFAELLRAFARAEPTRGELWVAEDPQTGELLGYAGVEVSALGGEADLINIAVASAQRRRGVGRAFIRRAISLGRRLGVSLLWLRVRASNAEAQRFYARMGFHERGQFAGYYADPPEPAIIMAMDVK